MQHEPGAVQHEEPREGEALPLHARVQNQLWRDQVHHRNISQVRRFFETFQRQIVRYFSKGPYI